MTNREAMERIFEIQQEVSEIAEEVGHIYNELTESELHDQIMKGKFQYAYGIYCSEYARACFEFDDIYVRLRDFDATLDDLQRQINMVTNEREAE